MSFRTFLEQAAHSGDLITIDKPINTTFELANVAHALEDGPFCLITQMVIRAGVCVPDLAPTAATLP